LTLEPVTVSSPCAQHFEDKDRLRKGKKDLRGGTGGSYGLMRVQRERGGREAGRRSRRRPVSMQVVCSVTSASELQRGRLLASGKFGPASPLLRMKSQPGRYGWKGGGEKATHCVSSSSRSSALLERRVVYAITLYVSVDSTLLVEAHKSRVEGGKGGMVVKRDHQRSSSRPVQARGRCAVCSAC
jgi:hypothetical protein